MGPTFVNWFSIAYIVNKRLNLNHIFVKFSLNLKFNMAAWVN